MDFPCRAGRARALVLQECPVCIPREGAGLARLTLSANLCTHTHTGMAWHKTPAAPTTPCEPSLNPFTAAGGKSCCQEWGTRCWWHLEPLRWEECGWTRLFSCVRSRGWRKEIEAQCNVRHKGGILGGLDGRRVRMESGVGRTPPFQAPALSWRRRVWKVGGN